MWRSYCRRKLLAESNYPMMPTLLDRQEETLKYKVFVRAWNVGGVAPGDDLCLDDWLDVRSNPCDIYVLGFQEIVPLKASNVLRASENTKITEQWNSLIQNALNHRMRHKERLDVHDISREFECKTSKLMVGIFITVWVRSNLLPHVQHLSGACIGCGIMGFLGNKVVSAASIINKNS